MLARPPDSRTPGNQPRALPGSEVQFRAVPEASGQHPPVSVTATEKPCPDGSGIPWQSGGSGGKGRETARPPEIQPPHPLAEGVPRSSGPVTAHGLDEHPADWSSRTPVNRAMTVAGGQAGWSYAESEMIVWLRMLTPGGCPESRSIRAAPTGDGDRQREAVPGYLRESGAIVP
jgi:hypothetical protein